MKKYFLMKRKGSGERKGRKKRKEKREVNKKSPQIKKDVGLI